MILSSKEFAGSNFIPFLSGLNLGRARPSWPRKALCAFTWEKITSILSYNQAASIHWVMIACQQRAVSTLWCREKDMQSREIDSGVIYILVREEELQADELSGNRWRGEGTASCLRRPSREGGGWQPCACWSQGGWTPGPLHREDPHPQIHDMTIWISLQIWMPWGQICLAQICFLVL